MNWADKPYAIGRGVCSITGRDELTTKFIKHLLTLNLPGLLQITGGGTFPNLRKEDLNGFRFSTHMNYRRIASILSAYDDLIENNLKRIKLLEEIAQRTYEEWFVKFRLNGEHLPIDENTGLPVGWEIIKVNDILGKTPSTLKVPSSQILENGIIPVIDQSRDFIAGFTNDQNACIDNNLPLIVFGDHTRVLKFINFKFARGADGTQLILSNNSRMPQHLFYFTLLNVDLSNYHYARHFKFLKDSDILLPDKISAEKFETVCKEKYDLISNLKLQNQKLKESRDILLPKLMNGTINVN
jgi:type I restriction enzyme S subunit